MACMMAGCPLGLISLGSAPRFSMVLTLAARSLAISTHQSEGLAAWAATLNNKLARTIASRKPAPGRITAIALAAEKGCLILYSRYARLAFQKNQAASCLKRGVTCSNKSIEII